MAFKQEPDTLAKHVENVVRTWTLVKKDLVGHGVVFYVRLLGENPEIRGLFSFGASFDADKSNPDQDPNLRKQAKMLMNMIDYAIRNLGNLEALLPKLKALGKKHFVKYKVKAEHFELVAAALLWTLDKGLGEIFTRDVEEAWTVILNIVSDVMIAGGKDAVVETSPQ